MSQARELEDQREEIERGRKAGEEQQGRIDSLVRTQNILQSEKEEELRRNIAHLTRALASKDSVVSNMVKEVERRSDAIRSCGEEIVKLRRTNSALDKERHELSSRLSEVSQTEEVEMSRIVSLVQSELGESLRFVVERTRYSAFLMPLANTPQVLAPPCPFPPPY